MPLAETPQLYTWTRGSKATVGWRGHFFICLKKHLSLYVLAEVKSTKGGGRRLKDLSVDDFTICFIYFYVH